MVIFTDKERHVTATTARLLAADAPREALAPAAAIATAAAPGGVPTSAAQCDALNQRRVQESYRHRPLDASTVAQFSACDHACSGDSGGTRPGAGGPLASEPQGRSSRTEVA